MKKIIASILVGLLVVSGCGNNNKSSEENKPSGNNSTVTEQKKDEKQGKKYKYTNSGINSIIGTDYVYNQMDYDRDVSGASGMNSALYYGSQSSKTGHNYAQVSVGFQEGFHKNKFKIEKLEDFKEKLFDVKNDFFYQMHEGVGGDSYFVPKITKEEKKTINDLEYMYIEFEVETYVSEKYYTPGKPEYKFYANGYFTLLDKNKAEGKLPFYVIRSYNDTTGADAKEKSAIVLEEVVDSIRKKEK